MATSKNKTAFDIARDYLGGVTSNVSSGVQKATSSIVNNTAHGFGDFYNTFSNAYDNFKKANQQQVKNNQNITTNFAKQAQDNVVNNTNRVSLKTKNFVNYFNDAASKVLKTTQDTAGDVIKTTPIAIRKLKGQTKAGLGLTLDAINNTIEDTPINGTIVDKLTGGKFMNNPITLRSLRPDIKLPTEDTANSLLSSGLQESKNADKQMSTLDPLKDEGFVKNIQNPRWVARNLTLNVPSFVSSLGLGAAVSFLTKNPTIGFGVAFGPSFLQNAGDMYSDAKANGANEKIARDVSKATGVILGLMDSFGIEGLLEKFAAPEMKEVAKKLIFKDVLENIAKNVTKEGATESLQQVIQNSAAKVYYDHQRDIFAGVPEAGFFGGIMGGIGSVTTDVAMNGIQNVQNMTPEERQAGFIDFNPNKENVDTTNNISDVDAQQGIEAIKTIESAKEGDVLTPQFTEAERIVRAIATKYIDPKIASEGSISDVINAVKSKITFEQGNISAQKFTPPDINQQTNDVSANPTDLGNQPITETPNDVVTSPDTNVNPSPPEIQTPPENMGANNQKERGLITSIKENQNIDPNIRESVSGTYDVTTDKGRIDYGKNYIQNNYSEGLKRILSNEPNSNEIAGISAAMFFDAQRKAWEAKNRGDMAGYDSYKNVAVEVANAMAKRTTTSAQTTEFARVMSQGTPEDMVQWVQDIYDEANKLKNFNIGHEIKKGLARLAGEKPKPFELTKEMRNEIGKKMEDIMLMPEGPEKVQATRDVMAQYTKDIPLPTFSLINAYRYQNMLSGLRTHERNIYQNAFNGLVLRPLQTLDMAAWDAIKSIATGKKRERFFSEVPIYYRALLGSVMEGSKNFKNSLLSSNPDLGKTEELYGQGFNQITAQKMPGILTIVGRFLTGEDEFFSTIIRNGEYARLKSLGKTDDVAMTQAQKLTDNILYREKLDPNNLMGQGKVLSGIDNFTNFLLGLRKHDPTGISGLFVPFVRVPMAVFKMGFEYNPVTGPLTAIGSADPAAQYSKARIGAAVMLMGLAAAMKGNATWEAPSDKKLKTAFYDSGRKPFSIKIGNNWVPMSYLGPLALPYGIPVAFKYFFDENKTSLTDSTEKKLFLSLMGVLNQWSQSTPLTGLGGFVRTAQGDIDYNTINNLSFTAGQFVPLNAMLGDIAKALDPVIRRTNGFKEGMFRNIPGYTTTMEPILSGSGLPATRNITDNVFPYGVGVVDAAQEDAFKALRTNQQYSTEANALKKQADDALTSPLSTSTKSTGAIDSRKKNLDTLLQAYNESTDPVFQAKVKEAIKRQGFDFNKSYEAYTTKDIKIDKKNLAPSTIKKLERSKQFEFVRRLRKKYDGTGLGGDLLASEMKSKNISQEALDYDDKTALPEDIKIDEIKTSIDGLSDKDLLATLMSYRKLSEGTRKPLLTDSVINQLENDGTISTETSDFLKTVGWNAADNSFYKIPKKPRKRSGRASSGVSVPRTVKGISQPKIRLTGVSGIGSARGAKTSYTPIKLSTKISTKRAKPKFQSISTKLPKRKKVSLSLKTSKKSLSSLGGKI